MGVKIELELGEETVPEKVVDADIESFNKWFQGLGNDPLIKSERAIIKTWLAWKLDLAKSVG